MIGLQFGIITLCMGFIACMLMMLVWNVLRKLVRIVEQATSDSTNSARMRALDDRVEASEQRARTALAKTNDVALQCDRLDASLKSHIARENIAKRDYKVQPEEEAESEGVAELLAAAQAIPVVSDESQPTNRRRRRRRRPGG